MVVPPSLAGRGATGVPTALGVDASPDRRVRQSAWTGILASMPADSTLLETVRRTRRELVEQGPRDVRADGDFGRVSIPGATATRSGTFCSTRMLES